MKNVIANDESDVFGSTSLSNRMCQHGEQISLYQEGPIGEAETVERETIRKGWAWKKKLELIVKALSPT